MGGVGSGVMTMKITPTRWLALALVGTAAVASACARSEAERTEAGSLDAAGLTTNSIVIATTPGVHVTSTDGRSIRKAMAYRLTPANFAAFMRAAEGLATLERGDSAVRAYLTATVSDAGPIDAEAGRTWLEANQKVRDAIAASGLSVQDYYVASIAVATAERFLNHPKTTPLTPALARNAQLLQSHGSDLARLHQLRRGR